MLVSLELGEVTLLATVHHHICKVQAREAYLRWKVQFDAEVDSSTDAFQFFWGDVDFVIFLCSVIVGNQLLITMQQTTTGSYASTQVNSRRGREMASSSGN